MLSNSWRAEPHAHPLSGAPGSSHARPYLPPGGLHHRQHIAARFAADVITEIVSFHGNPDFLEGLTNRSASSGLGSNLHPSPNTFQPGVVAHSEILPAVSQPIIGDARAHASWSSRPIYQQHDGPSAVQLQPSPFAPIRFGPRGLNNFSRTLNSGGQPGVSHTGPWNRSYTEGEIIAMDSHLHHHHRRNREEGPSSAWIHAETESQWSSWAHPNRALLPGSADPRGESQWPSWANRNLTPLPTSRDPRWPSWATHSQPLLPRNADPRMYPPRTTGRRGVPNRREDGYNPHMPHPGRPPYM